MSLLALIHKTNIIGHSDSETYCKPTYFTDETTVHVKGVPPCMGVEVISFSGK